MSPLNYHHHAFRATTVVLSYCAVASLSARDAQEEIASEHDRSVPPITEQEIDQFAEAYVVIEEIYAQTVKELDVIQTGAEMVIVGAEERVIRAVECTGLRLDEFNRIGKHTAMNGQLCARIARKVEGHRRNCGSRP